MRPLHSLSQSSFTALYRASVNHCLAIKSGTTASIYTANNIISGYAKCGEIRIASKMFGETSQRDAVSWNTMIAGFVNLGNFETALEFLKSMKRYGFAVDGYSFGSILKGVACVGYVEVGQQVHSMMVKMGYEGNVFAGSALLDMYAKCERVEDAFEVFKSINIRNSVTWNALISGYAQVGDRGTAFWLLDCMELEGVEIDDGTFAPLLTLLDDPDLHKLTTQVHAKIVKHGLASDTTVCNAIITAYSECGSIEDAERVFDGAIETRDLDHVSWNSILTGFSQSGLSEDALKFFENMRSQYVVIDHYAFSAVLRSCSDLATLQLGQQVHVLVLKSGFEPNGFVASSLIFMYSKCGVIEDARKSFDATPKDSSIAWNSLIFGYAQHGRGKIALDLFFLMKDRRVKLDHITFVAVLTACSHIGLVEEGWSFLKSMESDYGIPPRMEHYACMIDLLGRAGRLDEAKALIEAMPFEPDAMVWKTLLGACRTCGDIELASQVASHLLELEPEEHCTYVLLSSMFGHLRRWNEKASIKRLMKERGVKKVPGWSWIEVKNEVRSFNAEDRSHPNCEEIYLRLGELMEEIRRLDYVANSEFLQNNLLSDTLSGAIPGIVQLVGLSSFQSPLYGWQRLAERMTVNLRREKGDISQEAADIFWAF
ncbi:unnamed protein product, partial [Vitis vinifera]